LEKFQLNPNNSKVYIPQDGKDYAVVNVVGRDAMHCGSTTEIPVNFKAKENGVYTLTVSAPLTSHLSPLTLIDNLTGANVDLLANPSYTFESRTTDYASRFKLVFSGNGVNETTTTKLSPSSATANSSSTVKAPSKSSTPSAACSSQSNCQLLTANCQLLTSPQVCTCCASSTAI
jgi:hypothetical protein